jgi:hypothetical protein
LWRCNRKLPVIKPSKEFIKIINQSNNQEKILSLRLEANQFKPTMKLASSNTFTNVKSLTIYNFQDTKQICEMKIYFPTITYLSLRYDGKIDFHQVCKIFEIISCSTKRLDIYCDSISCSHYRLEHLFVRTNEFNKTLESFVLHVDHISRSLVNNCRQAFRECVLRTITDFIRVMSNIRYVRIITNKSSIKTLLDIVEWVALLDICQQLESIKLKGMKMGLNDEQLDQKFQEIVKELHSKRECIKFEVQIK